MECCFCREYTHNYDNPYYNELGLKIGVDSRILFETDNWYAIPTLGCLTVGYVLIVCKKHYQSLANLNSELYQEMLEIKKIVETTLLHKLGYHCLAFEHGVTDSNYIGANSVEHVHLHVVPFAQEIWTNIAKINDIVDFTVVVDYEKLFLEWKKKLPKTYLLFQDLNKVIYYKQNAKGFPSQFFRKCLATYLNVNQWDWRQEYYQKNFMETLKLFK